MHNHTNVFIFDTKLLPFPPEVSQKFDFGNHPAKRGEIGVLNFNGSCSYGRLPLQNIALRQSPLGEG
jgi:hypothetical protein